MEIATTNPGVITSMARVWMDAKSVKVDVKEDGRDKIVSKVILLASFTIVNLIHFTIMYFVKSFSLRIISFVIE